MQFILFNTIKGKIRSLHSHTKLSVKLQEIFVEIKRNTKGKDYFTENKKAREAGFLAA